MAETDQPLALAGGEMLDLRRLPPARVESLRKGSLICPVCHEEGRIIISDEGPLLSHQANHEPETPERHQAKTDLLSHMRGIIFPRAQIALNALVAGGVADLAVVRSNGTRIAIRLISESLEPEEIGTWIEALKKDRIQPMWLLDASRLPPAASRNAESEARAVSYRGVECTLIALDEPLLHYESERRLLHLVEPQPELIALAKQGSRSFGRVSSLITRYRLSSLHVRGGRWWLDRGLYENPLPVPGPPVPQRILERLHGKGRGAGQTSLRNPEQ